MLPNSMQRYLNEQSAAYVIEPDFAASARVPALFTPETPPWARAVLFESERGVLLAVVPSDCLLDLDALRKLAGGRLTPLSPAQTQAHFRDCDAGAWPALAEAYGMESVVDVRLYSQSIVRFSSGRDRMFLRMTVQQFQRVLGEVRLARFSIPIGSETATAQTGTAGGAEHPHASSSDRLIAGCGVLPPLPESGARIAALAADPAAGPVELARVIEQDGAMAATILRCANSSFYGYQGKIGDVRQAIARVLGFDMALALSLGMSVARTLHTPGESSATSTDYRRNAAYCAALVRTLATAMPREHQVQPGTAYAAALLHNVGRLFLAFAFPRENAVLDEHRLANLHAPGASIERWLFGISHGEAGERLLRAWRLPEAISCAARHHHDEGWRGEHAVYAHLVLVANRALARRGLATDESEQLPVGLLARLGLSEGQISAAANAVWQNRAALDNLAQLVG